MIEYQKNDTMKYDTVVIGAGLAGLVTACHLAQANQKVLVIANGAGAMLLASGCIDMLGYHPTDSREPLTAPLEKLDDFVADHAAHPYHLFDKQQLEAGMVAFQQLVGDYAGTAARNWLLPSTAGAIHPTCLAPSSLAQGDIQPGGSMLIVGFKALRDFYPALIANNLNAQDLSLKAAALTLDLPKPVAGKTNITPIELAKAFEQASFRQTLIQTIKAQADGHERIGFPAVLGLHHHQEVMTDFQKQFGKPVFEISTLPPSVPGRRLFEQLKQRLQQAGGRLIIGSKVMDGIIVDGQVTEIRMQTANRLRPVRAQNYVLATGGIYGGGLQTDDEGHVWEPIFNLPIEHTTNRHDWFEPKFVSSAGHPVSNYGVQVDGRLNPLNGDGPIATNLFIVGSSLAHTDWVSGRTGDGVAVTTAYRVKELIGITTS